jgi:hypothetical protein
MKITKAINLVACGLIIAATSCVFGETNPVENRSPSKYHDFLLKDGRSFRGRIVAYDQHTDIVSIERSDKQLIKTSPSVFDIADRIRIQDWHKAACFLSEHLFRVSARRIKVKRDKISYPGIWGPGRSENVRETYYEIAMSNGSALPFQDMWVEYHIHYTCHKKQGIKYGDFLVPELNPKSKKNVRTAVGIPFRISNNVSNSYAYVDAVADGICIRIIMPLSNGRNVLREYCLPDNLCKHRTWPEADVAPRRNKQ